MAIFLRTPQCPHPLFPPPFSCKPLRARSRLPNHVNVSNSAQTDPAHLLTSPISKTLFAISKTLTLTQSLAETLLNSLRHLSVRPSPFEEALILSVRSKLSMAGTGISVGCFAAISASSVNTPLTVVASGMAKWLELYSGVLMLRVLLSWFPNIPWERQPLQAIRDMCDPYLNLFRNIIPPLFNALDVSPLLAFLVLGVLTSILNTAVQA
eukprot:c16197_g1_i2 orf=89-718(+)